ncbi:hypothetical protein DSM106972_068150 [Dulcicalothrix desertica PCC 7102]|uniref:Uncharacterized protein n=1 Tax=Dulcicalothrix desertica PCC 7102 TaxID=232991 RepID=A0A3S1CEK8_9CYAN|nr:hypothetical protein [Dulcicalothrix desertica]RUT01264.1 hypothetical protein DSM106972_068150 [Dulcicalothrix desertica PCC 7102]TWH40585.1 hypothetical protein CAL7102_09928 [Dulcicalothrix desertica PCC 7102]
MSIITNYLYKLITKQIDDNGIVVWYDRELHFSDIVSTLNIPNTTVACYSNSFFKLRHEIESLMGATEPPRLLIYVPLDSSETYNALIATH